MVNRFAIILIKIYKIFISPVLGNNCKFHPTCSEFAIEALSQRPFFESIFLITKRLIRCNPWSNGGYDPLEVKEN